MDDLKVSVVIPNYNTWDLVERNVNACLKYDDANILEIIVVDDCSPTSVDRNFSEKVKIVRNKENLQYTKTVNVGLKEAIGNIIVLLDSDAYPVEPFIKRLISMYQSDASLGSIGFRTVDEDNSDTGNTMREPSVLSLISGQKLHGVLRKYNFLQSKNILPFSCAVSFRKNCLEGLDFFDESFPVLDADHDLSMRIYRSKWKLLYSSEIKIFHKGGGSIAKNYKRVILFHQSRWHLLKKHNKLRFEKLVKALLLMRIRVEILMLFFFFKSETSIQKLKGRRLLASEVSRF